MSVKEIIALISLVANLWGQSAEYMVCIAEKESEFSIVAIGDVESKTGESVGLFQIQSGTAAFALEKLDITWDQERFGDPRLCPYTNIVMAAKVMDMGYYHWWSTDDACKHLRE